MKKGVSVLGTAVPPPEIIVQRRILLKIFSILFLKKLHCNTDPSLPQP